MAKRVAGASGGRKPAPKKKVVPPARRPMRVVDTRVVNAIAIIVTLVWAVTFLADIGLKEYQPPAGINVAFMLVLGAIFGIKAIGSKYEED